MRITPPDSKSESILKYLGNIVVQRKDLVKICLDKKGQSYYDDMKFKVFKNEFIMEQAQREAETSDLLEEYLRNRRE